MKLQRFKKGQIFINVPKALANFKGWKRGDNILFREENGKIVLIRKKKEEKEDEDLW